MKPPRSDRRCSSARGFTLLEALVALVLTATVATLSMQILTHLARVERALAARTGGGAAPLLREVWLRETLAAATPLPAAPGPAMRADEKRLVFSSFVQPGPIRGQPAVVALTWRTEDDGRGLALVGQPALAGKSAQTLLWQAPVPARWRFRAEGGEWRDDWPPPVPSRLAGPLAPTEVDQLPQLVWLDAGAGPRPGVLVRLWTHPRPLPSRRAVEGL